MTNYDVVKKLIGNVMPIGETNQDEIRFKNLEAMCDLVEELLSEIDDVATYNKNKQEFSMRRSGEFADKFLTRQGIEH